MKLPSLCVAVLLLTLAGCSSYGPDKIRTGAKPPEPRTIQQVMNDVSAASNDLGKLVSGINDAETAKAAAPNVTAVYDRMKSLYREAKDIKRSATPEENQQFDTEFFGKILPAETAAMETLKDKAKKAPVIPPELAKAFTDGKQSLEQAKEEAKNAPAPTPPEILPENPPKSSSWVVWLLCILILAICVGLLFRDGLWSNAIRLVNVVFAGLLAMNFYEPVAKWMTNYSDDLHSFIAFFDFLALWGCFAVFMAIFRAATEAVSKVRVRFLQIADLWGGVVLSLCIGWVMAGFTLTTLHAGPLAQYPFIGSFQPQNKMFFGMLAPDREWLGFTKYQSSGPYCRSVDEAHFKQCIFPPDFIETQLERRMHLENYINGNTDHMIRVNTQFMTGKPKPAPKVDQK